MQRNSNLEEYENLKLDIERKGQLYFKEKEEEAYQKQLNNLDFKI